MASKLLRLACWVPFAWLAWYIWGLDPRLPLLDQWTLGQFYHDVAMGEAGWRDFLAPHNGSHPIVGPRLLLTPIALVSGLDFKIEIWISMALVMATIYAMRRILDGAGVGDGPAAGIVQLLCALLFCSPVLYWPWIWSAGFFHFSINLALIATAFFLIPDGSLNDRRRGRNLVLAMLCCATASTTRAEGLLSWLLFLPSMLTLTAPMATRARWRALWAAGASVCVLIFIYAFVYLREAGSRPLPSAGSMLDDFLLSALVALGLIGRPFVAGLQPLAPQEIPDPRVFVPIGVLIVLGFLALSWQHYRAGSGRIRDAALAWVAVGGFGLAFAGAAALARVSVLESRLLGDFWPMMYSATTALVGVAALQLGALRLGATGECPSALRRALVGAAAVVLASICVGYLTVGDRALRARANTVDSGHCWELIHLLAEKNLCFVALPPAHIVEEFARAGFREVRRDVAFAEGRGDPRLGQLEASVAVQEGVLNRELRGWVRAHEGGQRESVFIRLEGRLFGRAELGRAEGGRIPFVAGVHWRKARVGRARAYLYDRERRRLLPLAGVAQLPPRSAEAG